MKCPCCENETLHERGSCEVCPVCFWEDDPFMDESNLYEKSVSNHGLTLEEAKNHFIKWGAIDTKCMKHTITYEIFKLQINKKKLTKSLQRTRQTHGGLISFRLYRV